MEVKAALSNYRQGPEVAWATARRAPASPASPTRCAASPIRIKPAVIIGFSPKRIAAPMAKLLRSAVANAEQKNENQHAGIEIDNLVVSKIFVDEGPSMWRVRPRAQGRASWIQKRTSNINVVLAER